MCFFLLIILTIGDLPSPLKICLITGLTLARMFHCLLKVAKLVFVTKAKTGTETETETETETDGRWTNIKDTREGMVSQAETDPT